MESKRTYAFLILLALSSVASAESTFLKDAKDDFISPFTTDAKYILLTGGVLTLATLPLKSEDLREDAYETDPLGNSSKYGDLMGQLVPNILYAGGMWIHYKMKDNTDSKRRAILMTKATAYSSLMTTILKYSIRERRPDHSARNSFPSGHSTTIFAFAGIIGIEHEWYYAVPAYALGAFVGYSRLNDNKHYLADVIAGGAIGIAYAYGVSKVQQNKNVSASMLVPTPDMKGMMLAYGRTF